MPQRMAQEQPAHARPISVAGVLLLILVGFSIGCRQQPPTAEPGSSAAGRVLLIGVDGVEWNVLLPLLHEQKLPNLAGLMQRGTHGLLETFRPTMSPVIWTSVATGKGPAGHGIRHFAKLNDNNELTLYSGRDRRTKAIWNIVSDYDRRVCTVGWWMTFPAEAINGVMVSQTNTVDQVETNAGKNVWKGTLRPGIDGQVYPPERQKEMLAVLDEVQSQLPALTETIFGTFRHPHSALGRRLWDNCRWAFRADATYLRIGQTLLSESPGYDAALVYFGGPDVVGHRFWRYMYPEKYLDKPSPEQIENFGDVIRNYYRYVDAAVGRLIEAAPGDTNVLIVSDHGMHAVNRNATFSEDKPPKDVNSAEHQDGPPGVLFAAGPAIRTMDAKPPERLGRSDLRTLGSVLDITPTILAMLRIPAGEDMDGRVMTHLFTDTFDIFDIPDAVPTHDDPEFLADRGRAGPVSPNEAQRLEQLRSLGYIGGKENGK